MLTVVSRRIQRSAAEAVGRNGAVPLNSGTVCKRQRKGPANHASSSAFIDRAFQKAFIDRQLRFTVLCSFTFKFRLYYLFCPAKSVLFRWFQMSDPMWRSELWSTELRMGSCSCHVPFSGTRDVLPKRIHACGSCCALKWYTTFHPYEKCRHTNPSWYLVLVQKFMRKICFRRRDLIIHLFAV